MRTKLNICCLLLLLGFSVQNAIAQTRQAITDPLTPMTQHALLPNRADIEKTHKKTRADFEILISASIPENTLKHIISSAQLLRGTIVLRGLIHRDFKATALWLQGLGPKVASTVQIDPVLFERLHIKRVPTFILLNKKAKHCLKTSHCELNTNDVDVLTGSAPLDQVLLQFVQHGSANPQKAEQLLLKWREVQYAS